jgi:hypothetical protein
LPKEAPDFNATVKLLCLGLRSGASLKARHAGLEAFNLPLVYIQRLTGHNDQNSRDAAAVNAKKTSSAHEPKANNRPGPAACVAAGKEENSHQGAAGKGERIRSDCSFMVSSGDVTDVLT